MSARPTLPGAVQTSAAAPDKSTAAVVHVIATEAAILLDIIGELIGGGNEDANTLHAMRLVVARMGWMADTVAQAHGGPTWGSSAAAGGLAGCWFAQSESMGEALAGLTAGRTGAAADGAACPKGGEA